MGLLDCGHTDEARNDLFYAAVAECVRERDASHRHLALLCGVDVYRIGYFRSPSDIAEAQVVLPPWPGVHYLPCACGRARTSDYTPEGFFVRALVVPLQALEGVGLDWGGMDRWRLWRKEDGKDTPIFDVSYVTDSMTMASAAVVALPRVDERWEERFAEYREREFAQRGWRAVEERRASVSVGGGA